MQQVNETSSLYKRLNLYTYLKSQVADFSTYSDDIQELLFDLSSYTVANAHSAKWHGIDVRLSHSTNTRFLFDAGIDGRIERDSNMYMVSGVFPDNYGAITADIESLRRGLAASYHPVLSAGVSFSEKVNSPLFFFVEIAREKRQRPVLTKSRYVALVLNTDDPIYVAAQLSELVSSIPEPIITKELNRFYDYGYIIKVANDNGYKVDLKIDSINVEHELGNLLMLVPEDAVEIILQSLHAYNTTCIGEVREFTGNHRFIKNNRSFELSALLVSDVLLRVASYQTFDVYDKKLEDTFFANKNSSRISYNSPVELVSDLSLTSQQHLRDYFDSSTGVYKISYETSPYLSYISFKAGERFLVSSNLFGCDGEQSNPVDYALRIIYEHQTYGAEPIEVAINVVESASASERAFPLIAELRRTFDIFGVDFKIERSVDPRIKSDYVVGVVVVSKVQSKVANLLGNLVGKGDLIFVVDISGKEMEITGESGNVSLFSTNMMASKVVDLSDLKALFPISRGGLFFSLYTLSERRNLGFDITTDDDKPVKDFLFDEKMGRVVVVVADGAQNHLVDLIKEIGGTITLIGHFTKGEIRIDDQSQGFIADLKKKVSFAFQNNITQMSSKRIVKPYEESSATKKEQVASMFNNIAHKYDFLNHFLSLGIDKLWRRRLVKEVGKYAPSQILDMATGTGDLAIALSALKPESIVGLDISVNMVEIGVQKVKDKGLDSMVFLREGDSESIDFDSNTFDFATVAFGVRNFENPLKGLSEMHRVLKHGGGIAVLEFAMPTKFPFKQLYKFYFFNILPAIGRLFSKDTSAYTYLPESVEAFPSGPKFLELMANAGFTKTRAIPLTFGVANIYIGEK